MAIYSKNAKLAADETNALKIAAEYVPTNPFQEEIDSLEKISSTAKKVEAERLKMITGKQNDAAEKAYEVHLGKMESTLETYNDFVLDSMDKTTEEYQSGYIDSEMKKWSRVYGITQDQLDKINFLIIDDLKKTEDASESLFKGITENFTSAVQSEISGIFSDALRGDLDSAEDYFRSFTDSLIDIWAATMSKMVTEQIMAQFAANATISASKAQSGAGAAGSGAGGAMAGGVVGAFAGVALGMVSKWMGDKAARKAEEKAIRQLRDQTEKQVTASIAQLELSDLNYEIYQMNTRFEDLVETARKARMPLAEIIKLRGLETKALIEQATAGYSSLQGNITDFITGKQRENWTVSDWQREFGNLSDNLMMLDNTQDSYNNDSLKILNDQFEILKNIEVIQENQLRNLESTSQSLVAQAIGLQTSEGMPISREFFQDRYDELLSKALLPDENGMLNTTDIAFFQGFVSDYVGTMSTLGDDYNDLISGTSSDLLTINDAVQSEMEILTAALSMNTDAVDGNTAAIIGQLVDLGATIENIAAQQAVDAWVKALPDSDSINPTGNFGISSAGVLGGSQTSLKIMYDLQQATGKIDAKIQALSVWAELIDPNIAPEIGGWVEDWQAVLADYTKTTNLIQADTDNNMRISTAESLAWTARNDTIYASLLDLIDNIPPLATQAPSLDNIGVGTTHVPVPWSDIRPKKRKSSAESQPPINITLNVDGRQLAYTIVDQSRKNPELKQMLARG